jgi:hypothetical protein
MAKRAPTVHKIENALKGELKKTELEAERVIPRRRPRRWHYEARERF